MRQILIPLSKQVFPLERFLANVEETYRKFIEKDEPHSEELLMMLLNIVEVVYRNAPFNGHAMFRYPDDKNLYFEIKCYFQTPPSAEDMPEGLFGDMEKIRAEAEAIGIKEMYISEIGDLFHGINRRTA